jgi:hypothetical protein
VLSGRGLCVGLITRPEGLTEYSASLSPIAVFVALLPSAQAVHSTLPQPQDRGYFDHTDGVQQFCLLLL